jgi:leucyl/phenylalanyl-tRNA--protein transferase
MKNTQTPIPWLDNDQALPPPETAQKIGSEMAGLVAAGGGLSVARLCEAYQQGMFPWFSEGQPVLWWSPDPRMVLQTANFKLHRSLRKSLQKFIANPDCEIRIDSDFGAVIRHCAQTSRKGQPGTWIVDDMVGAYETLHAAGFAHSVETWVNGQLVGGLYCVSIGDTLFGESMFAHQTDASKIALAAFVAFARTHRLAWIDCQQNTQHLTSLGAREMPRSEFLQRVRQTPKTACYPWVFHPSDWHTLMPAKAIA